MIYFSETFKALRKDKNLTQEQSSIMGYLGISYA